MFSLAFLKSINWKAFLKGPGFIIIVAALCFYAGRRSAPAETKVVTVDKVVEIHRETQTVQQQVNIDAILKQIKESSKSIDRTVVREVITQNDGTKVERETETSHIDRTSKTNTDSQTKVSELTEVKKLIESLKQEDHVQIVEKLRPPDKWAIGLQVGYGKTDLNYIPNVPGHVVLGASVARTVDIPLIGNVGVGLWANSRLDGGLQLSKSF